MQANSGNADGILTAERGACIALVGGGGKTSIMLQLSSTSAQRGLSVLVTTTTRIWSPEDMPLRFFDECNGPNAGVFPLPHGSSVALGRELTPDGKVQGITQDEVCRLYRDRAADVILVEADGSAGRSLKVHRQGEPVVPECASLVLLVAGLDAIGRPVDSSSVHRVPEFCSLTGAVEGETITPEHVSIVLLAMARAIPPTLPATFVLNKRESAPSISSVGRVIDLLRASSRNRIVCTSRGRPVEYPEVTEHSAWPPWD